MVNKEALEGMTAEQVMQQFQEVKERRRAVIAQANDSIRVYERAVKARNDKIQELREDLSRQLTGIDDKTTALNAAMLKASIAGDDTKLDESQRALTELENQRSRLNARLESLAGKPPRCDEAYAAMEAAVAKIKGAEHQYASDANIICEFCEDMVRSWEKILSEFRYRGVDVHRDSLERARQHYSSERNGHIYE